MKVRISTPTIQVKIKAQKVFPGLEDLEVIPRAYEQTFNHPNSYGYDNVTVGAININLQDKTVTPTKQQQVVNADSEYDALRQVTVEPYSAELQDKNVKSGLTDQTITADSGYDGLGEVTVEKLELQNKIATPTITEQEITPDQQYDGLSKVTINAVTSAIDANIVPENIREGKSILGIPGNLDASNNAKLITEATGNRSILAFLNKIPKLTWTGATSLASFLNGASALEEIDVSGIDTSNVTNMQYCFMSCSHITSLDLSAWKFDNVTTMLNMFANMGALEEIIFPEDMDTSLVQNFSYLFLTCRALTSIPLEKLDTSSCTNFSYMFQNCSGLTSLTIPSNWDTNKATNMFAIFNGCTNIISADLSAFSFNDTTSVDMAQIFYNCPALETLSAFDCSKTTRFVNAFGVCRGLKNVGGFTDLGEAYLPSASANYGNYQIYLTDARELTHQSILNIFNSVYDIASAGVQTQQILIGPTNVAKMTPAEIAIATTKGWSVS